MIETTVDFIILRKNGMYFTRSKITNKGKTNHLLAYSFSTRDDAMRVAPRNSTIIRRICTLDDNQYREKEKK